MTHTENAEQLAREVLEALGWEISRVVNDYDGQTDWILTGPDGKQTGIGYGTQDSAWASAPNLLSLDVLLPMSDEWAREQDYYWEDYSPSRWGDQDYDSHLMGRDDFPEGHGPTRVIARLSAWLQAIRATEGERRP